MSKKSLNLYYEVTVAPFKNYFINSEWFPLKKKVTQNVPCKYYSQTVILRQCHTVQQDWALLWSVGSPLDAALSIAGKLAWTNIQLWCLFTDYLGCVTQPLSVAICTKDFIVCICSGRRLWRLVAVCTAFYSGLVLFQKQRSKICRHQCTICLR